MIDIIDTDEKIKELLPIVENMVESDHITMQKVTVVHYGRKDRSVNKRRSGTLSQCAPSS